MYLNRIIAFSFILLFASSLFSQTTFGIHVGRNASGLSYDESKTNGWTIKDGWAFGINRSQRLNEDFYLNNKLQYSEKGLNDYNEDINFPYVDLLNTVSYRPFSFIGFDLGLNVGRLVINPTEYIHPQSGFEFGVLSGISMKYKEVNFSAHYNHGLSEIKFRKNLSTSKIFNSNFQLTFGYDLFENKKPEVNIFDSNSTIDTSSIKLENEFGLMFSNLDGFNVIFKKQRNHNTYRRISILAASSTYNFIKGDDNSSLNFSLGITSGFEKRKPLRNNVYFYYGVEVALSFNNLSNSNNVRFIRINPGLRIPIGSFIKLNNNFKLGIELQPSIYSTFEIRSGDLSRIIPISLNASNNYADIFVTYAW